MALTSQQKNELRQKYNITPINAPTKLSNISPKVLAGNGSDFINDIKQAGSSLKQTFNETKENFGEIKNDFKTGEQGFIRSTLQGAGVLAGGLSKSIGDVITGVGKAILPQSGEDKVKEVIGKVATPIVESDTFKSVMDKYNSLDESTKRDIDASIGIVSLLTDVVGFGIGKNVAKKGIQTGLELGKDLGKNTTKSAIKITERFTDTIEDFGRKIKEPEVSQATKVSLNPNKALSGTDQDIQVSVNGQLKKLSEVTPEENIRIQESTAKSLDKFTEQAKKFANDRSVAGGSPVEIVGDRVDKVLNFADKKRQIIGKQMGDIEIKYVNNSLPVSEKTTSVFTDALKNFDNPKFGVDTADSKVVRKLVEDFDKLESGGATIGERLEFVRSWDKYLNDAKDSFGKFKENATANTRIQNAVKTLKDETVDAISEIDKTYKGLRSQYRTYKQLDEIGDALLGKDGALGQRIKGAATVKRAIQSNSDAGARQFLAKLKELTGYDAIKEGDLALTAMESAGDYQGLSLLNIVKEGKSGLINKGLEFLRDKTVGTNAERVKSYINKTTNTTKKAPISKTSERIISESIPQKKNIFQKAVDKFKSIPNKQGGMIRIGGKEFKEIPEATKKEMIEAIDYINLKKDFNRGMEETILKLQEKYNISTDWSSNKIADTLEKLIEGTKTK